MELLIGTSYPVYINTSSIEDCRNEWNEQSSEKYIPILSHETNTMVIPREYHLDERDTYEEEK